MTLFLASSLQNTISILAMKAPKVGKGCQVMFIRNAADEVEEPWWVRSDREAFTSLGCEIVDVDLRKTTKEEMRELLGRSEVIHFCGGSVLLLLSVLQKSGLAGVVVDAVRKGEIIYTGTSAGSMIAAKDVTLAQYDGGETEYLNLISEYRALGLVNFMILPHTNNPDIVADNKKVMEHLAENKTPLIFLNDDQAVFVEGERFEILSV